MKATAFEKIQAKKFSLSEQVAKQISQLIICQQLTCAEKLPSEFELAKRFNVGRSTIRESIKLLVSRNVLEIRRGKGTYIASNPGEISDPLGLKYYPNQFQLALDLAEIRHQMEPWIVQLAAEQATEEDMKSLREFCAMAEADTLVGQNHTQSDVMFHTYIAKCTRNLVLQKLIPIIAYTSKVFSTLEEVPFITEMLVEHREIMDAICNRDGELAAKVMTRHIEHGKAMLIRIGADPPVPASPSRGTGLSRPR